jgi:hypothetical protein
MSADIANAGAWLPAVDRNSVISPLGIEASLCGLQPAMSREATSEVMAVLSAKCTAPPSYVSTSIWIPEYWSLSPQVAISISDYGQLERGAEPFNDSIGRWLANLGALPLSNGNPIVFASVSALKYSARWEFSNAGRAYPGPFHGLHRTRTVPFATNIRFATLDEFPECQRVAIDLADGGKVFLTSAIPTDRLERCFEEAQKPYSKASSAAVSLPEVLLQSTTSLRGVLQEHGVRTIFRASSDPFPGLRSDQPLSDVDQSVRFRLDRNGVGVEATTVTDYALTGGGIVPHRIVFDKPFDVRVLDSIGNDVADATIDDV